MKEEAYTPMIPPDEPEEQEFPADSAESEETQPQFPDRDAMIDEILADAAHGTAESVRTEHPLFPVTDPAAAELLTEPGAAPGLGAVPEEPEQHLHLLLRIFLILLSLAVLAFAGFCIWQDVRHGTTAGGYYPAGNIVEVQLAQEKKPELNETLIDASGRYTIEGVAETVMPSIVEIYTYSENRMVGSGSGIILTKDGFIATNAHVIANAESFSVRLYGDSEQRYTGTVIGHDTKTDLAVLKISAGDLPPARLGDSAEVKLGEAVCALGNPAGLNSSITTGIISGKNRKVRSDSSNFQMECFQTDAAISPGNSGGALVNMFGQVIGITSSKYSSSILTGTTYEGLGFAITIDEALPILKELMEQGYVSGRVRIGIRFLEHANALAQLQKEDVPDIIRDTGIRVMKIDEDSGFVDTEMELGDWIITMNGKPITNSDSITEALKDKKAGDRVHCACCRIREDGSVYSYEADVLLMEDHSGDY